MTAPDPALTQAIRDLWMYRSDILPRISDEIAQTVATALESGALAEHGYPGKMERQYGLGPGRPLFRLAAE